MDKGFVHHQAVARLWAAVALKLADSVVLPLDIRSYAQVIDRSLRDIEEKFGASLESNNVTLSKPFSFVVFIKKTQVYFSRIHSHVR